MAHGDDVRKSYTGNKIHADAPFPDIAIRNGKMHPGKTLQTMPANSEMIEQHFIWRTGLLVFKINLN